MLKKNDTIQLDIIDMTKEGLGVAKKDGIVFFVKDALPFDIVDAIITKVSKNIIYAKTIDILKPSKYRIDSLCPYANSCGGCQLLSFDYKKQLELKKDFVIKNIKTIGKIETSDIYDEMIGMTNPYHFRNKMQVPFCKRDDKIVYGFYASRTHYVISFDKCISGFEGSEIILNVIKETLNQFHITIYDAANHKGAFREVLLRIGNVSKEVSITYVVNEDKIDSKKIDFYKSFDSVIRNDIEKKIEKKEFSITTTMLNVNNKNTNVILGDKNFLLFGKGYIKDFIGDITYQISPESFYQVNMDMTKKLYDKIVEYGSFDGSKIVIDLFCGIGTISLYVAKYVKKVFGIEIIEKAVENAKENAKINKINNANFILADVNNGFEKIYEKYLKNNLYDCIIIDPPRKGLSKETIDVIKKISPSKIIYVSCDSATLARDLNLLCNEDAKYQVTKLSNVDMFPHTTHIETVCLLSNRKPDTKVRIDVDLEDYYRIKDAKKNQN